MLEFVVAGLPALRGGEPGQVRKEAATATAASAGGKARHTCLWRVWRAFWASIWKHSLPSSLAGRERRLNGSRLDGEMMK